MSETLDLEHLERAATPAMRQYFAFKKQHPGCVLFFRMGDFYEMFYEDAKLAHRVLGVTLTQRTEGVPMAGVPYHAVHSYLRRMIQAGHRVAVCEQMEDPATAKGVVRREVTRVITPGTLTDESMLEEGRENPLVAVMFLGAGESGVGFRVSGVGKNTPNISAPKPNTLNPTPFPVAVAWAELSTGAFHVATFAADELSDELARIGPRELLYVETADGQAPGRVKAIGESLGVALTGRPGWQFRQDEALETLRRQFGVATLGGFGLGDDDPTLGPASAIVHYLLETQKAAGDMRETASVSATPPGSPNQKSEIRNPKSLRHLQPPRRFAREKHLVIDQVSLRSLEIERTTRSGQTQGTLLGVLLAGGECRTAMGKRALRQWLCYPLCDREAIGQRQRVVGAMVDDPRFLSELRDVLDGVQDVQRIVGRISVGRAMPRDLVALGTSSAKAQSLATLLADRPAVAEHHGRLADVAGPLTELSTLLREACVEAPPNHLRDGGLIRDGYDTRLDESRGLQRDSHTWLASYQKELIDQTGIQSLKVGFNKIFGYYIELSAANMNKAPAAWSRKQTLKNAERYITPQLKEFEGKVLTAEQRAVAREQELFVQLCEKAQDHLPQLHALAEVVAELDVLACFARRAVRFRYVKPLMVDEPVLRVRAGRHPVLDELLRDQFVPNDVELGCRVLGVGCREESDGDADAESALHPTPNTLNPTLALITGPNMAGKSTYIRQTALITLLAHTGSFVPADEATVGLCDRIFTRIGASDELHTGQSTFMVEMTETANICHHATPGSLVILDEIGRGTSTLDGLSLAWAIAEHLAVRGCRTLFATHYHELTALAESHPQIANLHVTVREWQDQVVFLHRIAPGSTDQSYGIHVAKIAGLPDGVVARARELLGRLAVSHASPDGLAAATPATVPANAQLSLFTEYLDHPAVAQLRQLDLTRLSPLDAFDVLRKLRELTDRPTP